MGDCPAMPRASPGNRGTRARTGMAAGIAHGGRDAAPTTGRRRLTEDGKTETSMARLTGSHAMENETAQTTGNESNPGWLVRWAIVAGCIVAGVRLLLVACWGGDTPYLDECNMTGLLHMYSAHRPLGIDWGWLVYPIGEHRLVVQRLWSLFITGINGREWDVYAELFANTFVWGALTAMLVILAGRRLSRSGLACFAMFAALAEAIPHAWENLLWSFQSQFVFLVAFSVAAIAAFATGRVWSARWWGGVAAAVAAFGSQVGGIACLPIGAALLLARSWRHGVRARAQTALGGIILIALALVFRWLMVHTPTYDAHRPALSVWLNACGSLLAWPFSGWKLAALVMWTPAVVFVIQRCRVRRPWSAWEWFLTGLVAWSFAMAMASAWSRGQFLAMDLPPSRYADVCVIGVIANAACLLALAGGGWHRRIVRAALVAGWAIAAVEGMVLYTAELSDRPTLATITQKMSLNEFIETRARQRHGYLEYIRTHDPRVLQMYPVIYPVPEHLAIVIDGLREAHRWPAALDPARAAEMPWLSRLSRHATLIGWLVLAGGGIVFLDTMRRNSPRAV